MCNTQEIFYNTSMKRLCKDELIHYFTFPLYNSLCIKVIEGNTEPRCGKLVTFDPWLYADAIRIKPLQWYRSIGLRFEILGCKDGTVLYQLSTCFGATVPVEQGTRAPTPPPPPPSVLR